MEPVAVFTVVFDADVAAHDVDLDDLGEGVALAPNHVLVVSPLTQSHLYHELKRRLPGGSALFVGMLGATPKMKGQAAGSVGWIREAVETNGLFTER